jgi:hypothetical protein
MRRQFNRDMPPQQRFVQGRMSFGNAIEKNIRANKTVQPGNTFNKVIRPEFPSDCSG